MPFLSPISTQASEAWEVHTREGQRCQGNVSEFYTSSLEVGEPQLSFLLMREHSLLLCVVSRLLFLSLLESLLLKGRHLITY